MFLPTDIVICLSFYGYSGIMYYSGSLSFQSLLNSQQLVHGVLDTVLEAMVLDTKLLLRLGGVQLENLVIHVVSGLAFCQSFLELRERLSDVVDNVLVVESLRIGLISLLVTKSGKELLTPLQIKNRPSISRATVS